MLKLVRRVAVAVLGILVVIAGVAMLFLPGPGLVTIAVGLALLGSEFERPRRWVATLRDRYLP